ncbi:MAG TPA: glycosyl transferase family protein [Bryobacteraceae bacterium]|nr:glycosyl transferase family protein [Bryobacteraceae bacterium]
MDHFVALLLVPLALWVLLSGLDDCVIDAAAAIAWFRLLFNGSPDDGELAAAPARRIAIYVAAWQEHRVIQSMLDNNLARLRYPLVDFFVGAYPNDAPTLAAVREAMNRHPNIHLALCPHGGPTSKADCLNWIYQRMLLFEEEHRVRFDMIVTHDAEDIIDPHALTWINYYAQWYDMIQIPVLALPTPLRELTHGVYCDEFSEYQHRDMMARSLMGGFIPSNGVGTGFSRRALDMLATVYSNRIFEPVCLTEDYENGFRVGNLGLPQKFIPVHLRAGRVIATREYFPRTFCNAVRQRTRWITGIALQSWEFHSFGETLAHAYWFWRDRKSLVGNLVGPLTNLVFFYGLATFAWAATFHRDWQFGREVAWWAPMAAAGLALQCLHTAIRMASSARVYGFRFAAAVPLRIVWGNWINCWASCRAMAGYAAAKWRGQPLRWVKTEHAYPTRAALLSDRRKLGEILTSGGWVSPARLETALASLAAGDRLGEYLISLGDLTEDNLYIALALQNRLETGPPASSEISLPVTRSLPAAIARKWRVLPFRIAAGELYLAGPELPAEEMQEEIRRFSSLETRFHLVTPADYDELAARYLPGPPRPALQNIDGSRRHQRQRGQ